MANFWWNAEQGNVHKDIFSLVKTLDQQSTRDSDFRNFIRLYGQSRIYNESSRTTINLTEVHARNNKEDRIKLNVIQSIIDTIASKITKNRPKPMFLTKDGNITLRRRARNLSDFIESLFLKVDAYETMTQVFRDACIFGSGFVKATRDNNDICIERVYPGEVFVDDAEAFYNTPRGMHQRKKVPKEVLLREFPEFRAEILAVGESERKHGNSKLTEQVDVVESWHLPSGPVEEGKPHDGRHTLCIKGADLVDEPWDKDYFSILKLDWTKPVVGFWGQGLAEQLSGIQFEINKLLFRIQQAMHLVSVPRVFIDGNASVVKGHLTNIIGSVIRYSGAPPVINTPPSMSAEVFGHLDRLYQRAYEIAGVSQLAAQSKKPGGLDSGVALREFNDIETERFMTVGQSYERAFIDLSKRVIDIARDIADDEGSFPLKIVTSDSIREIDWSQVNLPEDEYHLSIFPVSMLPSTPAGRLQTVQELIGAGFIPREEALKLLDYPDMQEYTRLETAQIDDIDKVIELIYEEGADGYSPPESLQNLPLGIKKMQAEYLQARLSDVDEDRLELMREWISSATSLMTGMQKAAQAQKQQLAQELNPQAEQVQQAAQQAAIQQTPAQQPGV